MNGEVAENLEAIQRLLKNQSTLVLGTVGAGHQPHTTPLFYLTGPELAVYWFSSPSSLHSRNLQRDSQASISVYAPTERWNEICGVQMQGTVEKIGSRALRRQISQAYRERFHLSSIFRVTMARSGLYEFRPAWVRYLDNRKHFGFKFEMKISQIPPTV
jgi:uncharacterized protein YhbP (UPF0306 family)